LNLDQAAAPRFTMLQTIRRSGCSACSAYPWEKIRTSIRVSERLSQHFCNVQALDFKSVSRCLQITRNFSNAEVQPETPSEIVVKKAETPLRFAETSQQTLRQILLLPTTYINFAEKNALKSKKLRQLTHTTIVDSIVVWSLAGPARTLVVKKILRPQPANGTLRTLATATIIAVPISICALSSGVALNYKEPRMPQSLTAGETKEELRTPTARRKNFSAIFNLLGPFLILLFVCGLFAVIMPADVRGSFFGIYNFKLILTQTVIVAIGALGMTMIIVSGGIDLSVGSVIALTSVLAAWLLKEGHSIAAAYTAAIGLGALIGLVNGSIISIFRMTPFIVTLGMLGIARGLSKWLAENMTVNLPPDIPLLKLLSIQLLMAVPEPEKPTSLFLSPGIVIAIDLAIIMTIVMKRTVFGRYIFAIGSNEATARLCGIRTRLVKTGIYTLAGVFFGLAGVMQFSRLRQGDPSTAIGIELDIIAAVVIGGASLNGGTGSILGSMIGALTMSVLRSGSTQSDWPNYMQEIIIGIVIILAVGLDKWRQSRTKVS